MISAAKFDAPNMAAPVQTARALRFDIFELDLHAGELRKRGVRLRLQGQPLQVLAALLRRAGEVVTREDFEERSGRRVRSSISTTASTMPSRAFAKLLGDSAEIPRYIETLPRRGYKFIAPVEEVQDERPSQLPEKPALKRSSPWPHCLQPAAVHAESSRSSSCWRSDLGAGWRGAIFRPGRPVLPYVLLPFFPWQILVATPPRTTSPMA